MTGPGTPAGIPPGGRTPIFEDEALDVSGFAPKPAASAAARPAQVRAVAEPAAFRSREPAPVAVAGPPPARREPRRHRTGRNVQLNLKVRQVDADAFYALADANDWVLGEAFQRAVAALQKASDS